MSKKQDIHIGTSGWHYAHWKGPFYPEGMSNNRLIAYYAERFDTAEINNTFYQLPKEKTLADWREAVPPDFVFPVKASQYITHRKKLTDGDKTLPPFLDRVQILGNKLLGPFSFSTPRAGGLMPNVYGNSLINCRIITGMHSSSVIKAGSTMKSTRYWKRKTQLFASITWQEINRLIL